VCSIPLSLSPLGEQSRRVPEFPRFWSSGASRTRAAYQTASPLSLPLSEGTHRRKNIIARNVHGHATRERVAPPAECFRNRRSKLAPFFFTRERARERAAPAVELRWSLPLRSITPLIIFKSGVTRRPLLAVTGGSSAPRCAAPVHYTRRMELLRYFIISLTLSGGLLPTRIILEYRTRCLQRSARSLSLSFSASLSFLPLSSCSATRCAPQPLRSCRSRRQISD